MYPRAPPLHKPIQAVCSTKKRHALIHLFFSFPLPICQHKPRKWIETHLPPRCAPSPQIRRLSERLLAHDLRSDVAAGAEQTGPWNLVDVSGLLVETHVRHLHTCQTNARWKKYVTDAHYPPWSRLETISERLTDTQSISKQQQYLLVTYVRGGLGMTTALSARPYKAWVRNYLTLEKT